MANNATQKVILLWFEGESDELAFANYITYRINEALGEEKSKYKIISFAGEKDAKEELYKGMGIYTTTKGLGDITYNDWGDSSEKYIKKVLKNSVLPELNFHIKIEDICQIVHIIDTDCAWLPVDMLQEDKNLKPKYSLKNAYNKAKLINKYYENKVVTSDLNWLKKVRKQKQDNVADCLEVSLSCGARKISNAYYNIFFNSINLDHITTGNPNVSEERFFKGKISCARDFANKNSLQDFSGYKNMIKNNPEVFFAGDSYESATRKLTKKPNIECSHRHSTIDKIAEVVKANLIR